MTIESIFLAAVKRGPIIILDNMKDRTHAATTDPLVDHSPLIRLAILAVDLGADPDQIEFNGYVTRSTAPGGWSASAVMYNVGADCPELTRALQSGLPTLGFHYCPLNAMYFVDEFGAYGQRIKADRAKDGNENVRDPIVWIDPAATRFDRGLGKHYRVVDRIREHFERRGWITAAERLAKCLAPPNPVQSESAASAVRFPEGSPVAEAGQTEEAAKARAEACIVIVSPDGQPVRDILVGHPVTLRNDDNSGVCAWRWSMLSKPDGSTVSVHRATSSVLNFTPDVAGLYQFRLQVNGAELASMRSEVGLCAVNASAPSKGAGAKARADAELAREAKREFAEHVIVTDGIRDAKARGTDPDRAIVGLSNPIGERFEPGTPEAAARSERVSPPTPWEQICARAHALGYHAHVERAPATTDADELRIVLRVSRRWVVDHCTLEMLGDYERAAGDAWVRAGVWRRRDPAPQFSGDRPGQACDGVAIMHRPGRKVWNGGGSAAYWEVLVVHADRVHATQKEVAGMMRMVEQFTDPGDLVLDTHCGSGTTGVACLRLGRRFLGIEVDAAMAETARERLRAEERMVGVVSTRAGQGALFGVA